MRKKFGLCRGKRTRYGLTERRLLSTAERRARVLPQRRGGQKNVGFFGFNEKSSNGKSLRNNFISLRLKKLARRSVSIRGLWDIFCPGTGVHPSSLSASISERIICHESRMDSALRARRSAEERAEEGDAVGFESSAGSGKALGREFRTD